MILCWAALTAILGCMQPTCHRLDTPALESTEFGVKDLL